MGKVCLILRPAKKRLPRVWHYENGGSCQALCREREPLFNTYIPDHNVTSSIADVTCSQCKKIMRQRGIA
jgi:hypothetical protein